MTGTVLLSMIVACSFTEDWEEQTLADEGAVCLFAGEDAVDPWGVFEGQIEPQSYNDVDPIVVHFVANTCLSSSCSRNAAAGCTATVVGDTVEITAEASWEENVAPDAACTDDCGILDAQCEVGVLAEGTYTVTFGDQTQTLTVSSKDAVCLER